MLLCIATAEPDGARKTPASTTKTLRPVSVAGRSQRVCKLNAKGETRLHIAARLDKVSDVITLLVEGADINARDYAGQSSIGSISLV